MMEENQQLRKINFQVEDLLRRGRTCYSDAENFERDSIGFSHALSKASSRATPYGIICTVPQLVAGMVEAPKNHFLWKGIKKYSRISCRNYRFTQLDALSEEHVSEDIEGKFAKKGEKVVVTIHGGGVRYLFDEYLGKMKYHFYKNEEDVKKFLETEGELPTGETIPMYCLEDVRAEKVIDPFGRYGVVVPLGEIDSFERNISQREFINNPLILARAGSPEYLERLFDRISPIQLDFERNKKKTGGFLGISPDRFCERDSGGRGNFVAIEPKENVVARVEEKLEEMLREESLGHELKIELGDEVE